MTFNINGNSKTVKTDSNGRILININIPGEVSSADISYSGNVIKQPVKNSSANKVKIIPTKIQASQKTFKVKTKIKKFQVTLKDKNNKVIKNKKIILKIKGKTYTAKTNKYGNAIFKITKLNKKGKYSANILFNGDKIYKSSSKTVKIIVKK